MNRSTQTDRRLHLTGRRVARGMSMIEALCACSIAATVLGTSMGGMKDFMLSQRLQAAASELESQIQLARATAAAGAQTVRLAIQQVDQGSCTLIHTGAKDACQCGADGAAACAGSEEVLLLTRNDARHGVRIASSNMSLAFSAARGTVTPTATIKLVDTQGRAVHQIVNVMGRVRSCSPSSAIPGYRAC